jgi:hypothetical protein
MKLLLIIVLVLQLVGICSIFEEIQGLRMAQMLNCSLLHDRLRVNGELPGVNNCR